MTPEAFCLGDRRPCRRELLERAVDRLRQLCGGLLHRSYPRLTRPPSNLETDELVGGVVAGLITALQKVRPQTVRQFFALANQHTHWQLNDLARHLDQRPRLAAVVGVSVKTVLGRFCFLLREGYTACEPVSYLNWRLGERGIAGSTPPLTRPSILWIGQARPLSS